MNFKYHESKQAEKVVLNSSKYSFTLRKTCDLSCACLISKKTKLDIPNLMDEAYTH